MARFKRLALGSVIRHLVAGRDRPAPWLQAENALRHQRGADIGPFRGVLLNPSARGAG